MPLATFANVTLGDSHALDHGQALAQLVVTAIADAANEQRPDGAEDARAIWELVGVNPDPLSSKALSVGLGVGVDHPLASILTSHSAAAKPIVLTLPRPRDGRSILYPLTAAPSLSRTPRSSRQPRAKRGMGRPSSVHGAGHRLQWLCSFGSSVRSEPHVLSTPTSTSQASASPDGLAAVPERHRG